MALRDTILIIVLVIIDDCWMNAVPDASLGFCVRERVGTRSRCTSPAVYVTDLDFALVRTPPGPVKSRMYELHMGLPLAMLGLLARGD
jgi:hypothetical protein